MLKAISLILISLFVIFSLPVFSMNRVADEVLSPKNPSKRQKIPTSKEGSENERESDSNPQGFEALFTSKDETYTKKIQPKLFSVS